MERRCPDDNEILEKALFYTVEVDYCPRCLGIWFEKDELRWAKDAKDKNLNWLDVDVWRDKGKFEVFRSQRYCPDCRISLCQVAYDNSEINIDFCKKCEGIWLDRGEFKQIINYLKKKADYEILHRYTKNLILELWEVFSGPETFRSELEDFFTLLKLFNYKFLTQHPHIANLINTLPK